MNGLRWIFGFPLAIFAAFVFSRIWRYLFGEILYDYTIEHTQFKHIMETTGVSMTNFILVFLSCWFIPSSRKFVGLAWIIFVIVSASIFHPQSLPIGGSSWDLAPIVVKFAGLLAGFYLSYLKFNNNGWNSVHTDEQTEYDQNL